MSRYAKSKSPVRDLAIIAKTVAGGCSVPKELHSAVRSEVRARHGVGPAAGEVGGEGGHGTGTVQIVDPCTDGRWDALARSHGRLFESPRWLAAMRDAFGVVPSASLVEDGTGAVVAGLAVATIDDCIGRRLMSLPFSDYSDPIGPAADAYFASLLDPWLAASVAYGIRTRRCDLVDAEPRLTQRGASGVARCRPSALDATSCGRD